MITEINFHTLIFHTLILTHQKVHGHNPVYKKQALVIESLFLT